MIDASIRFCLCPNRQQMGVLVANEACGYSKRVKGAFSLVMLHLPDGQAAKGVGYWQACSSCPVIVGLAFEGATIPYDLPLPTRQILPVLNTCHQPGEANGRVYFEQLCTGYCRSSDGLAQGRILNSMK
jgi:hypothetical protein